MGITIIRGASVVFVAAWAGCTGCAPMNGPAATPVTSVAYHVSPNGADANPGTQERPFATLERARDAIRELKKRPGGVPTGGVTVLVHGGIYPRAETFELTAEDSGTVDAPIIYRAANDEAVALCGGPSFSLTEFKLVDDPATLARLPATARGKVMQLDLKARGITEFGQMPLYGHSMHAISAYTRYEAGPPAPELFCNGEVMTLARWPNEDYVRIDEVVEMGSVVRHWDDKLKGRVAKFGVGAGTETYVPPEERPDPPHGFAIAIDSDRPLRWTAAEDPWMYGFWYWNWSDQSVRLESVDADTGVLRSHHPSCYGVKKGQHFYVYNLLEEIDQPGEWYLNRTTGVLYFYPPEGLHEATVQMSLLADPLVEMTQVSHVTLQGLRFEAARGTAVVITDGMENLLRNCVIRGLAGSAVTVNGGMRHGVAGCSIETIGARGIALTGGNRRTLTPAGHYAIDNHIRNFARVVQTYAPAIALAGVGNRAAHNRIHDGPHTAIMFHGNDHVIEYNDIFDVMKNATDMGAIYAGRSHTMWGNKIRNNYFHDIETQIEDGHNTGHARLVHAIYLDDTLAGIEITGNVFHRVKEALAATGSDLVFANNILIDCKSAVWWKSRAEQREYGSYQSDEDRRKRQLSATIEKDIAAMPYRSDVWRSRYPNLVTSIEETYGPQRCVITNNVLVNTPSGEGVGMSNLQGNVLKDNMFLNRAVLDTGVVRDNLVVKPNPLFERWATEGLPNVYSPESCRFTIDNDLVTDQDPGFVDPANDDFRLRPDSVVYSLLPSFRPISFEKIGPRCQVGPEDALGTHPVEQ